MTEPLLVSAPDAFNVKVEALVDTAAVVAAPTLLITAPDVNVKSP